MRPKWRETVDKKLLIKDLYETLLVKINGEEIIFADKKNNRHKPWLDEKISKIKWKFFDRYMEHLENSTDIAPRALAKIKSMSAKILSNIEDPKEKIFRDVEGWLLEKFRLAKLQVISP